jgi:hypothetical protein
MLKSEPSFDPRPLNVGSGWYVSVSWSYGQIEHVPGFTSEHEARLGSMQSQRTGYGVEGTQDTTRYRVTKGPSLLRTRCRGRAIGNSGYHSGIGPITRGLGGRWIYWFQARSSLSLAPFYSGTACRVAERLTVLLVPNWNRILPLRSALPCINRRGHEVTGPFFQNV